MRESGHAPTYGLRGGAGGHPADEFLGGINGDLHVGVAGLGCLQQLFQISLCGDQGTVGFVVGHAIGPQEYAVGRQGRPEPVPVMDIRAGCLAVDQTEGKG